MLLTLLMLLLILFISINLFETKEHFPYVFWARRNFSLRRIDKYHYNLPHISYPLYNPYVHPYTYPYRVPHSLCNYWGFRPIQYWYHC